MKLVALKSMGRLRPGDEFEVNRTQARALKALGKAQDAPTPAPAEVEREALRAQAEAAGVEVDGRWGADRLKDEIAGAEKPARVPRFYRRRDMTAEE
jgi:hypothetical protein